MVSLSDWREPFHFTSIVSVWLVHFFSGIYKQFTPKVCTFVYSGPTISCVNRVEHLSVICPKHALSHAMLDSSSICSEGSALLHFNQ